MIDIIEVEKIHDILIENFGGLKEIRDKGLLESSLNRPFQTFDGQELYPHPIHKAAAIFESIITNHPFVDGNKRTAYVLMRLMLKNNNIDIHTDQNDKYDFVIKAASGQMSFEQIITWIKDNIK